MIITILCDNSDSWFIPYGIELKNKLECKGHSATFVNNKSDIKKGDICFLLSCTKLIENEFLKLNSNNIVVHASDLPSGKGFAPMQWQIVEGKDEITLTLFEAVDKVDAGPYYLKSKLQFTGNELYDELRKKLGSMIIEMCLEFVNKYKTQKPIEQTGIESFYTKRTQKDDEIDVNKSIKELFNQFRIADNDRYPLYFYYRGSKYYIKIYKDK